MKNLLKIILFIFCLNLPLILNAQEDKIDSLLQLTKMAKQDTTIYDAYLQLGFAFQNSNPDSAIYFHNLAINTAEKISNPDGELRKGRAINGIGVDNYIKGNYSTALEQYKLSLTIADRYLYNTDKKIQRKSKELQSSSYGNIGNIYYSLGEYNKTLDYYFKASKIFEDLGKRNVQATILGNIGVIHKNLGNYPEALSYYNEALGICKEINDEYGVANNLGNIGIIYANQGNYSKALEYYFKSLKINEKTGNKNDQAGNFLNIGDVYSLQGKSDKALQYNFEALKIHKDIGNQFGEAVTLESIGRVYFDLQDYDKALEHHFRALAIQEEIGDKSGLASNFGNIGLVYYHKGIYSKGLEYFYKSLEIYKELKDKKGEAVISGSIGEVYLKLKKYKESEEYLSRAIQIGEGLSIIADLKGFYFTLSDLYSTTGRVNEALDAFKKHSMYKDSLMSEENRNALVQKEMQFEFEKKTAADSIANAKKIEIKDAKLAQHQAELNSKKIQLYFLISGLIVVLASSFLLSKRLRITRKQNRIISMQKEQIEEERNKSDQLLLNILPTETALELKKNGETKAKRYEEVTVLFSDFVNFTQITEELDPKDLILELDKMFKEFDSITELHRMEKIKTIGDSYMCAGGVPIANKTNAIDAVLTGLEFQRFIEDKASKLGENNIWQIRLGIHTGEVVAGVVGKKRFAYDIWGDTVNVASRMESSGKSGKVNISESTYNIIKNYFDCEIRGEIEAKNKGKIKMYFVNGIKPEYSVNGLGFEPNETFKSILSRMV